MPYTHLIDELIQTLGETPKEQYERLNVLIETSKNIEQKEFDLRNAQFKLRGLITQIAITVKQPKNPNLSIEEYNEDIVCEVLRLVTNFIASENSPN